MNIIDLSLTIDNECMNCGTPWHQQVKIETMGTVESVGRNTSSILLGSHSATHMDAPMHFLEEKYGIDKIDINMCIGPVNCVDLRYKSACDVVTIEDLKEISVSERMLFVFGWYKKWKTEDYYKHFPYFNDEAIKYLVSKGMRLIALDTPSPDDGSAIKEKDDSPNHKYLLSRDIIIIEYLSNTDAIDFKKRHEIIALPLKISDADGAPSRVVLKEMD